jgi:hypothetical protein
MISSHETFRLEMCMHFLYLLRALHTAYFIFLDPIKQYFFLKSTYHKALNYAVISIVLLPLPSITLLSITFNLFPYGDTVD